MAVNSSSGMKKIVQKWNHFSLTYKLNFDVTKFVRFGSSHLFSVKSTPMCSSHPHVSFEILIKMIIKHWYDRKLVDNWQSKLIVIPQRSKSIIEFNAWMSSMISKIAFSEWGGDDDVRCDVTLKYPESMSLSFNRVYSGPKLHVDMAVRVGRKV